MAFVPAAVVNFYIDESGEKVMHGKTIGFFEYLKKAYGWKTEHIAAPDKRWGGQEPPGPNGTFNGMIGMVQRGETDLAACIITISHIRYQVVDFSFPYYYDSVRYMSNKPGYAPKWEVLVFPFKLDAWLAIFLSFFIFSLLFYLVMLMSEDQSYTFSSCVMECYKQYFGASTDQWPTKVIPKWIFAIWCLMAMILSKAYSGNLLAALTKQVLMPKIDTLEDLANSARHELIFFGPANHLEYFSKSEDALFKRVMKDKYRVMIIIVSKHNLLQDFKVKPVSMHIVGHFLWLGHILLFCYCYKFNEYKDTFRRTDFDGCSSDTFF